MVALGRELIGDAHKIFLSFGWFNTIARDYSNHKD